MATIQYMTGMLNSDVSITQSNNHYDGPSVTLSTGTWFLCGTINIVNESNTDYTLDTAELRSLPAYCEGRASGIVGPKETISLSISGIVIVPSGTSKVWSISARSGGKNNRILTGSFLNALKIS